MKFFLINLLCLASFVLSAQSKVEKDTLLANLLFTEVKSNKLTDAQAGILLSETVNLYKKSAEAGKAKVIRNYAEKRALSISKETDTKQLVDIYLLIMKADRGHAHGKIITLGEEIRKITETASPQYFETVIYLVESYAYSGASEKLEKLITEAETIISDEKNNVPEKYEVVPLYAGLFFNYLIRNYEKAILYGEEMEKKNEKYQLLDREALISGYDNIALTYSYLSDIEKAISYYNKILKLIDEDEIVYRASVFGSMAQVYNYADLEKSRTYTEKAIAGLSVNEKEFGQNIGIICINQGLYCDKGGDEKGAEMYLERSFNYLGNSFANIILARIALRRKNYQKALDNAQKGIIAYCTNFKSTDYQDNPSKYETYVNSFYAAIALRAKMNILRETGEQEGSEQKLRLARKTGELANYINYLFLQESVGYENVRMQYNQKIYENYSDLMMIDYALYESKGKEEDANRYFQVAESKKIMALLDVFKPNNLPDTINRQEKSLTDSISFYEQKIALSESSQSESYKKSLFNAVQNMEKFVDKLEKEYPNYYSEQYKSLEISIKDIQQELDESTLMIEYSISDTLLFIHAITADKHEIVRTRLTKKDFSVFGEFRKTLQNPLLQQTANRNKFIDQSYLLYHLLIAPVADYCDGKQNLMIIPERELFYVPFEALLASNEKANFENLDFLVKTYAVNYQYSATAYLQLQQKKAIKTNSILAFAPVFENGITLSENIRSLDFLTDSLYRSIENDKFTPLPSTVFEVEEIIKILDDEDNAVVLLESDATKFNLNNELERKPYRFIHIATHGLVNYKKPKLSGLACYQSDDGLTGGDIYFSNEIQMQDIRADLVILSSCESGIGQLINGEGLIALNRSFIYAGAKNVLFSLWKVNDTYTKDLMIDFYRNVIEKEKPYTSALRDAKINMIKNSATASPRYWAPFILMGE